MCNSLGNYDTLQCNFYTWIMDTILQKSGRKSAYKYPSSKEGGEEKILKWKKRDSFCPSLSIPTTIFSFTFTGGIFACCHPSFTWVDHHILFWRLKQRRKNVIAFPQLNLHSSTDTDHVCSLHEYPSWEEDYIPNLLWLEEDIRAFVECYPSLFKFMKKKQWISMWLFSFDQSVQTKFFLIVASV